MEKQPSGPRLNSNQRMQVFAMLARGDNSTQINQFLQANYGIQLAVPAFTDMRKRHAETIAAMRETIQTHAALDAEALMQKSRRLINKKLDRAARDSDELEELDAAYRSGEISKMDYDTRRKTLLDLSLTELNTVAKDMHKQSDIGSSDSPKTSSPADSTTNQAILAALQSNDAVVLQKLIFKPLE